jgi:hypothetical protein
MFSTAIQSVEKNNKQELQEMAVFFEKLDKALDDFY